MPRPRRPRRHARRHGTGSVSRRGEGWAATPPRTLDPKRRPRYGFASREAAEAWLDDELARHRRGLSGDDREMPLGRYLLLWLGRQADLAPQTRRGYVVAVRNAATLAGRPLAGLTHRDFAGLWAELQRGGLASSTIATRRRILAIALNAAVPDLIPANPIRRARAPRSEPRDVRPLEQTEARRFLACADRSRFAAFWRLMLGIGPRPSELRALQWADLDLEAGTVTIRRSLTEHGRIEGPTKTRRQRTVRLPGPCLSALRRHGADQVLESPWVFRHPTGRHNTGKPYAATTFRLEFARLAKQAELPPINLYDLRHTAATAMIARGIPIPDVAYILGHANPTTTMKVYTKWLPSHQQRAAEMMAEVFPEE